MAYTIEVNGMFTRWPSATHAAHVAMRHARQGFEVILRKHGEIIAIYNRTA
ncbi:MAG: hypothetical protein ACKO0Z_05050 [Betaproteobacteria bacterium]